MVTNDKPFGMHSCYRNILSLSLKSSHITKTATTREHVTIRREAFGELVWEHDSNKLSIRKQFAPFPPFLGAPTMVSIALTERCNLRCRHCYPTVRNVQLSFPVIARLLDELRAMDVFSLSLSGGEPLLHPDLDSIIALGRKKGFHLLLFTNGLLITEQKAQKLKALGINEVNISLDAANADQHDRFRGISGAFEKSVRAVRHCIHAGLDTWITCTVSNAVQVHAVDMVQLAFDLGVSRIRFVQVVNSGNAYLQGLTYDPAWAEQLDGVLALMRERTEKEYGPASYFDFQTWRGIFRTNLPYSPYGCGAGTLRARITADGRVLACPFVSGSLPDAEESVKPDNILEKPFAEIWKRSRYLKVFRSGSLKVQGRCGVCEYNQAWCRAGCRAEALIQLQKLDASDPLCSYQPRGQVVDIPYTI